MNPAPYIEKWLIFTQVDGRWDIQLWADNAKPVSGKVYPLKVRVPAELIGEAQATVACHEPQRVETQVES